MSENTLQNFSTYLQLETKAMTRSFETLQYRQDLVAITHYHNRKNFPTPRCLENHNNTCAENLKIRGLKFDTL